MTAQNSSMTQPAWLAGLNERQDQAVRLPSASALVVAGAGSGKTKVLTSRIAYLIHNLQVPPSQIMAVTFTNKAAREMAERLEKTGTDPRGMWVGTFHGLCNRFLRRFHKAAGLPSGFQILDTDDSKSLLKRLYKDHGWSEERLPSKEAYAFIASRKEQGIRPQRVRADSSRELFLKEVFEAYEAQLQQEGAVDFPELMLKTVELLQDNEDIRFWAQEQFRQVLVDEFQDTNKLQYRWLKLITGMENPVFAVGDLDQSIYGFRGAVPENMRHFIEDFGVGDHVIRLEQNYRSHGNILKAANAVIANNTSRMEKTLWTSQGDGRLLHLKEALSGDEEASFLAAEAAKLREEGADMSQIAFLYRTNAQSRALEHALFQAGLPYRVHGGLRFFERAEIKHAMGYLRLAANSADDSALLRIINFPARGIGAKTLERLSKEAILKGISVWDAILATKDSEPAKTREALEGFVSLIDSLRNEAAKGDLPSLVERAIAKSGLIAFYNSEKDGADRVENLKELISAAKSFSGDVISDSPTLEAFLAHAALEAGEHGAKEGESAVQMMTVHSAKGLEFDHVFLAGLEEGIFPHANSLAKTDSIEEERRLMYVAITRARKGLTITRARERSLYGKTEANLPSRFLDEIPEELLHRLSSPTRNVGSWSSSKPSSSSSYASAYSARRESRQPQRSAGSSFQAPSRAADPNDPLAPGRLVRHAKFGLGQIRRKIATGSADEAVEIDFEEHGRKQLIVKYAKLEPVDPDRKTPSP